MPSKPRLLATCWTSAGDAAPQVGDERSPHDLMSRMSAAAEAGWEGFGIVHADLITAMETHDLSDIRRRAVELGLRRLELEFIGDWWTDGDRRSASDKVRRDLLSAAEILEVPVIKVGASMDSVAPPSHIVVEELRLLASEASSHGVRVALEPMPFSSNVQTLSDGVALLEAVNHPALGLAVDIWHVYRSAVPYEWITQNVRPETIFVVELNDGAAEPQGTLWDDTVDRRLYPGDGAFNVPAFIQAVRKTGFDDMWGVEIISAAHRRRNPSDSLRDVYEATTRCFDFAETMA